MMARPAERSDDLPGVLDSAFKNDILARLSALESKYKPDVPPTKGNQEVASTVTPSRHDNPSSSTPDASKSTTSSQPSPRERQLDARLKAKNKTIESLTAANSLLQKRLRDVRDALKEWQKFGGTLGVSEPGKQKVAAPAPAIKEPGSTVLASRDLRSVSEILRADERLDREIEMQENETDAPDTVDLEGRAFALDTPVRAVQMDGTVRSSPIQIEEQAKVKAMGSAAAPAQETFLSNTEDRSSEESEAPRKPRLGKRERELLEKNCTELVDYMRSIPDSVRSSVRKQAIDGFMMELALLEAQKNNATTSDANVPPANEATSPTGRQSPVSDVVEAPRLAAAPMPPVFPSSNQPSTSLKAYQEKLMRDEQREKRRLLGQQSISIETELPTFPFPPHMPLFPGNHALQDYAYRAMLREQENKKKLLAATMIAKSKANGALPPQPSPLVTNPVSSEGINPPFHAASCSPSRNHALQDYQMQMMLLDQRKKKEEFLAGMQANAVEDNIVPPSRPQPQASPTGNHALQDYQMQMMLLEQQNKKKEFLAGKPANSPGDKTTTPTLPQPQMSSAGNHALPDYQVQLMLLEQRNKERLEIPQTTPKPNTITQAQRNSREGLSQEEVLALADLEYANRRRRAERSPPYAPAQVLAMADLEYQNRKRRAENAGARSRTPLDNLSTNRPVSSKKEKEKQKDMTDNPLKRIKVESQDGLPAPQSKTPKHLSDVTRPLTPTSMHTRAPEAPIDTFARAVRIGGLPASMTPSANTKAKVKYTDGPFATPSAKEAGTEGERLIRPRLTDEFMQRFARPSVIKPRTRQKTPPGYWNVDMPRSSQSQDAS